MDLKTIAAVLIAAIVTFAATTFLSSSKDVVDAGLDAQAKEQMREVIREEMQVDINGDTMTYGQVLSSLHTDMTAVKATMDVMISE